MNEQNPINFALVAALYNSDEADFNTDLFIPVVKYQLSLFIQDADGEYQDKDCSCLKESIEQNFGITLPLVVLKRLMIHISDKREGLSIHFYNDYSYRATQNWHGTSGVSIEAKKSEMEQQFKALDDGFDEYLKINNIDAKHNFAALVEANTSEVVQYVEQGVVQDVINEDYIHISNYLVGLKETNYKLFAAANHIMWASTIAVFLKRKTIDPGMKPAKTITYYLDTKVVLALLDLANTEQVNYQKDVLNHIKLAGCVPVVHALTIREIEQILYAVEQSHGPIPYSGIENAYYRRNLNPAEVCKIRVNLKELIRKIGLEIDDVQKHILESEIRAYESKSCVKKMRKERFESHGQLRSIHDCYMIDLIRKKQSRPSHLEKATCFFVTNNDSLIHTANNENVPVFLKPNYVILDLWAHNICSTIDDSAVLTTIISKSFALNDFDTRTKMRLFVKVLKSIKGEDLNHEQYKEMYSSLINRCTKTIKGIERIDECETEEDKQKLVDEIQKHAHEDYEKQHMLHTELEGKYMYVNEENDKIKNQLLASIAAREKQKEEFSKRDKQKNKKIRSEEIKALKSQINNLHDKKKIRYQDIKSEVKDGRLYWKSFSYICSYALYVISSVLKYVLIIALLYLAYMAYDMFINNAEKYNALNTLGTLFSAVLGGLSYFENENFNKRRVALKENIVENKVSYLLSIDNKYHMYDLQLAEKEEKLNQLLER